MVILIQRRPVGREIIVPGQLFNFNLVHIMNQDQAIAFAGQ